MGTFVSSRQVRQNINLMTPWWLSGASIDLDFDNARYYDSSLGGSASLAPLNSYLSISRASTGYAKTAAGTLTSFGNDSLRITDLGLLVEDARTNLILDSQDATTVNWTKFSFVSATANTIAAPDGTTTADTLTNLTTGPYCEVNTPGTSVLANTSYTASIYVKRNNADWFMLRGYDPNTPEFTVSQWFNINSGTIGTHSTSGTGVWISSAIEALANGWYRLQLTFQATSAVTGGLTLVIEPSLDADNSGTGTIGNSTYVWGAQLEQAAFPSSYIPTSGASATRAADAITCSGALSTILISTTLSAIADVKQIGSNDWSRFLTANLAAPGLLQKLSSSEKIRVDYGGGDPTLEIASVFPSGQTYAGGVKVGIALNSSGRSIVGGGGTVATDSRAYTGAANMTLGTYTDNYPMAYYRRLTVWNSKLADATLQSLTAP